MLPTFSVSSSTAATVALASFWTVSRTSAPTCVRTMSPAKSLMLVALRSIRKRSRLSW